MRAAVQDGQRGAGRASSREVPGEESMGRAIEGLARHVAKTPLAAIPAEVRRHARLVLLDTLGVILAGSRQPELRAWRARLGATAGQGATILAEGWPAAAPPLAAMVNGTAGRSIELCESHRFVHCQAGVQVLPAVLATAEATGASGAEMLAAFILGYDVAIRLGAGTTMRKLSHQNGQTALIGAIAAGARLRGLDAAETARALSIGAAFMLAPAYTNAVAGATALNLAGGMSGLAGALVPELALAGFQGQADGVEESLTHLVAQGFDAEAALAELGTRWEVTRNAFRLRACCIPTYASLDALEAALAELRPAPAQIARIEVATYAFAAAMRDQDPVNAFAARYSLPHAAAAIVLRGEAGLEAFDDPQVHDPAFVALRRRVQVTEDPALTARYPTDKPGRATVTLTDGRSATVARDSARGDFRQPYAEEEIRAKFRDLAGRLLAPAAVARAEAAVERIEDWSSAATLLGILRDG
jgi:2-methylcitrate dehydratase PrpD